MLGITHARAGSQRGFTLIEMSIVLVIIGLIIGGILKGQEIIESSRQKNVITQLDSMKASINTFADKFNALPGDYSLAPARINGSLAAGGNDDGIVGTQNGTQALVLAYDAPAIAESVEFWNHLTAAELISGTTLNGLTTQFGDGGSFPATAIPGTGMTAVYGPHTVAANDRQTHWVRIHKNVGATTGDGTVDGSMSGKRTFEVDLKLDDGLPSYGSMRTFSVDADCSATEAYTSLSNVQTCVPYFELVQ